MGNVAPLQWAGAFFVLLVPSARKTQAICVKPFSPIRLVQPASVSRERSSVWLGRTEPREGGAGDEPDDGTVERRCCVLYRRLCVMQFMSSIPDPINKAAHIDAAPDDLDVCPAPCGLTRVFFSQGFGRISARRQGHRYARLSTSPPVQFRDWHLAPLRSSVQQRRCTLDEMESFEVAARPGQRGRLREVGWGSMP